MTGLPGLKRIYWDGDEALSTGQKKTAAISFMKENPGILVIFESDELIKGWNRLEAPWKDKLKELSGLGDDPTKEELHGLLKIEEMDMENSGITTLNPVRQLYNLRSLNISGVKVDDYSQLGDALELEKLNISGTSLKDLEVLKSIDKLEILHIENTEVTSLSPLEGKIHLKFIYADGSSITDQEAFKFTTNTPDCVVIFKSEEMVQWWNDLPDAWEDYFSASFKLSSPPGTEQLHGILFLNRLEITDRNGIKSLDPIKIMQGLKTLRLKSLPLSEIKALSSLVNLEQLECTQMPLSDLTPISGLKKITELNINNTTVSDLESIGGLDNIRKLKISGTQVKSLKPIASFVNLEAIELNNTPVKSIKQLLPFARLKSVECYNTKISEKTIESFKEDKPACNVVYY
jgi:Leucine-rich repeat (LRR) protein